jgi:hypothetical protein
MRPRILVAALLACGCTAESVGPHDPGLEGLTLARVDPGLLLPGTKIVLSGSSFVDDTFGVTRLHLVGALDSGVAIDHTFAVQFVSGSRLQATVDADFIAGIGGQLAGTFGGMAAVEVLSSIDRRRHATPPLGVQLRLAASSTPRLDQVGDGVAFVNQPIQAVGDGFLLDGEGETHALMQGCFTPAGQSTCGAPVSVSVPSSPAAAFDRAHLSFPYATSVSGVGPGTFVGTVEIDNLHASGALVASAALPVRFDIQPPTVTRVSPSGASLGQYVFFDGGGFAGGAPDEATLLALTGSFTPRGGGAALPLDLQLVLGFVSGPEVRYVLDETDPLGQVIDLRKSAGTISGKAQLMVAKGAVQVMADPITLTLDINPVRQVVFVNFLPSYVDSLRKFGLRAVDPQIRARVLEVARRDYAGTNMDYRVAPADDFALYSQVDIAGPDPNGLGLFGYDNTPGKDVGNQRLYDHIGGVNAVTQADGMSGYGGIFTESFFGFSAHPNSLAQRLDVGPTVFDAIFDPFRPDVGGVEVSASELAALQPPTLSDGTSCPVRSKDRAQQIACAVWVLGNLVGTTMTHEIGHSLGLADPYGPLFHNPGDLPNRLMEAGGDRPFNERAEIFGEGPGVFCDDDYTYLRAILPSSDPPPTVMRPVCN